MALKNIKFYGIKFRCHDDAGIAKINVYNASHQITRAGTTHTNTTIDGLSSTSDLDVGMHVSGAGIPTNSKIATIVGSTSITIDNAATASATVSITFTQCDLSNRLVDLFQIDQVDASGQYISYIFWVTLDPATDTYWVIDTHSGTHNAGAVGPNYSIEIDNYIYQNELELPQSYVQLYTSHEDYAGESNIYTLAEGVTTTLHKQAFFNGDALTDTFVLFGSQRAESIIQFSTDNGATWRAPNHFTLTWGDNSPDYDNNTINSSTGYAGVVFSSPPLTGVNNVIIEYTPRATTAYLETQLILPTDGIDYINHTAEFRVLDQLLEIK